MTRTKRLLRYGHVQRIPPQGRRKRVITRKSWRQGIQKEVGEAGLGKIEK